MPPLRIGHPAATGARASRDLPAPIDLAATVGVSTGIDRVLQQILQLRSVGRAPLQLPFAKPFAHPDAEPDVVLDQITQERVQGAELLELTKDEPHHLLDLLVRIEGHLPRRSPDVAGRDGEGELAPAGLAEPSLLHALLENVQLGFTHGPLEPEQ
jgi:hypothetical protein